VVVTGKRINALPNPATPSSPVMMTVGNVNALVTMCATIPYYAQNTLISSAVI